LLHDSQINILKRYNIVDGSATPGVSVYGRWNYSSDVSFTNLYDGNDYYMTLTDADVIADNKSDGWFEITVEGSISPYESYILGSGYGWTWNKYVNSFDDIENDARKYGPQIFLVYTHVWDYKNLEEFILDVNKANETYGGYIFTTMSNATESVTGHEFGWGG